MPEFKSRDSRFTNITLQHLLDMHSGLNYTEGTYNLKDDGIRLGFRPNLEKHILKIKIAEAPGRFKYQSVNTMLLGLVIKRTTGKHLAAYLEEKLWKPLGTESYATWNIVSKKRKMEIASSAINATARDFAKLGRLFLKKGKWNNTQIVDSAWINTIASIDTMNIYGDYKNQWWSRKISNYFHSIPAVQFKQKKNFRHYTKRRLPIQC